MRVYFLSVKKLAEELGVCEATIRRSIRTGHIDAIRTSGGPRASYRIPSSEVDRIRLFNLKLLDGK